MSCNLTETGKAALVKYQLAKKDKAAVSEKKYYKDRLNYSEGEPRKAVAVLLDKRWLPDEFWLYKVPAGVAWNNAACEPRKDLTLVGKFSWHDRFDEMVKRVEAA